MSEIPTMASPETAELIKALTKRLTPTDARLNYLTDLLKPMLGVGEPEDRNAFYAASRMLGCTPAFAKNIVGAVARRGSAKAWRRWRARKPALPVFEVPPLAPNLVGFVYFASPISAPNVVKIGISTNLERRLRDLEVETGEEHRIARWFVGTTVDEAVAQFAVAGRRITGKWFKTGEPGQIPGFLPMGLEAMQQALGSDLLKGRAA
ncbi:GIY-YIG nuclease family protein [Xanthobacter oligotrophicus]|uniref:GIY-YIG nuclease family protein n=1 Tax=Xanthobacter oligotrophicus TaxID=2607286 RepID=A0ABW6ZUT5_9HYPH